MATTMFDMLRRFQDLNVKAIAMQAMAKTADDLVRLNREQLYHGDDSTGNFLKKYRDPDYAELKRFMNPLPGEGNPDLYLTGKTYESMEVDIDGENIEYLMDDPYGLKEKYGDEIQGLTVDNKSRHVRENLQPVFVNLVKEKLRL